MNLWNMPGVPRKGWKNVDVIDLERDYDTCEMCGHDPIRYVHIMEHPEFPRRLRVGCVCAEKMCEGYNAKGRERDLKSRAARRWRWVTHGWRWTKKGNSCRKEGEHWLVIWEDRYRPGKYKYSIDGDVSHESFESIVATQMALFDKFYPPS
jgi:hypothetical protein